MFRYFVYLCLLAFAVTQDVNYNSVSANVPEPSVYLEPPEPAPALAPITAASQYVAVTPIAAASQQQIQPIPPMPLNTEYYKDFYYIKTPAESVVHQQVAQATQPVDTLNQHLNVVFITASESSSRPHHQQPLRNAPLLQAVEETKSHIYVLGKEPGQSVINIPAAEQHITTTHQPYQPEVIYMNYKFPAEANQQQQQIAQQYGGANILDLGGQVAAANVNRQYLAPAATNLNKQYLAPATAAQPAPAPSNAYILRIFISNDKYL